MLGELLDVCRTWARGSPALGPKRGVKDHGRGKNASEQHLGAVLAQRRRCKRDRDESCAGHPVGKESDLVILDWFGR